MAPWVLLRLATGVLSAFLWATGTAHAPFRLPFKLAHRPPVGRRGRFGAPRHYGPHHGVDFAVPVGTPVYAARPGKVVYAHPFSLIDDWGRGYGGMVIVAHPDGSRTLYGHLERVDVRRGQKVGRSTRLGLTGDEDNGDSSGPHLHFMILTRKGKAVNPNRVLGKSL